MSPLSSHTCTLDVLRTSSSLHLLMEERRWLPDVHPSSGSAHRQVDSPALHQGRCPSLMLAAPPWQLTPHTSGTNQQPNGRAPAKPARATRCTRWEIYAGVRRRSPTSRGEALPHSFSRHPRDRVLHRHVEEKVPPPLPSALSPGRKLLYARISEQRWRGHSSSTF